MQQHLDLHLMAMPLAYTPKVLTEMPGITATNYGERAGRPARSSE